VCIRTTTGAHADPKAEESLLLCRATVQPALPFPPAPLCAPAIVVILRTEKNLCYPFHLPHQVSLSVASPGLPTELPPFPGAMRALQGLPRRVCRRAAPGPAGQAGDPPLLDSPRQTGNTGWKQRAEEAEASARQQFPAPPSSSQPLPAAGAWRLRQQGHELWRGQENWLMVDAGTEQKPKMANLESCRVSLVSDVW